MDLLDVDQVLTGIMQDVELTQATTAMTRPPLGVDLTITAIILVRLDANLTITVVAPDMG
jgi:hypothetical protein